MSDATPVCRKSDLVCDEADAGGTVVVTSMIGSALFAIAIAIGCTSPAAAAPPPKPPLQITAHAKGMTVVVELTNRSRRRLCLLLSMGNDELGLRQSAIDAYYGSEPLHTFPSRPKPSIRCLAAGEQLVLLSNPVDMDCADEGTLVTVTYSTEMLLDDKHPTQLLAKRICPTCWIGSVTSDPVTLPANPPGSTYCHQQ